MLVVIIIIFALMILMGIGAVLIWKSKSTDERMLMLDSIFGSDYEWQDLAEKKGPLGTWARKVLEKRNNRRTKGHPDKDAE
ncbi:hypothetical protein WDW89_08700 [Deltaproteobacteria bacterium TL4]